MILNRTLQGLLIKQAGVSDYLKKALIGGLIGGGAGGTAGGIFGNKLWSDLYDARRELSDTGSDAKMISDLKGLIDHHAAIRMPFTGTREGEGPPGGGGIIPEVKGVPSQLPFLGAGAGVLAGGLGGLGYQAIQDLLTKE